MPKWSRSAPVAAVKGHCSGVDHPTVHQKQLRCTKIIIFHYDLHTTAAPPEHNGVAQDLQE
jgi:hypothetical protein